MASKRGQRRRACGKKIKHEKDAAFREALRLRRIYPGERIDAYVCDYCGQWHVGHRTKEQQQSISARRRRTA